MQRPKWHDYIMGASGRVATAQQKQERAERDIVRLVKELDKEHGRQEAVDISTETLQQAGLYEPVAHILERMRHEA